MTLDSEPSAEDVASVSAVLDCEETLFRDPDPLVSRPSKRLLVVGCPRSGTTYFTRVLRRFGLRVEHERMGEDGTVDATFTVPRTTADPAGWTEKGLWQYRFDAVIHLVRNPIQVIESLTRELFPAWWTWQEIHTGIAIAGERPTLEEAAAFWLWWTQTADTLAQGHRIQVESTYGWDLAANPGRAPKREAWDLAELGAHRDAVLARAWQYGYPVGSPGTLGPTRPAGWGNP